MKKTVSVLLILVMALSLCACGEARSYAKSEASYADYSANDSYIATEEAYGAEAPIPAPYDMKDAGLSASGTPQSNSSGSSAPAERPGKIIYSANVQVETTDFDGSLAKLDELVEQFGGWVESSSVNGSNYSDRSRGNVSRRSASYTLRFPSDRFQELMNGLSVLGNIPYTHVYTENVTAQYYDVQARLTAYTTQEQRLLEMMQKAETVEDVILLEDRLTQVRYNIESLQSSLNNWDRQVSFSTVYLDLSEVQEYTPEPQVQPSFGQELADAFKTGLRGAGKFFSSLLLLLAKVLPALVILGVLALIVLLIVKLSVKHHRTKKAAKPSAPAPRPVSEPKDEERS